MQKSLDTAIKCGGRGGQQHKAEVNDLDKKELDRMKTYIIYHHIKYPATTYKAEATPENMQILKQYENITFVIDRIVSE